MYSLSMEPVAMNERMTRGSAFSNGRQRAPTRKSCVEPAYEFMNAKIRLKTEP